MDDFEYIDPKELNELFKTIVQAQKQKTKKNLTFPFEYDILEKSKNINLSGKNK